MMPKAAGPLPLVPISDTPFIASVREYRAQRRNYQNWECPDSPPWVVTLVDEGARMSLRSLSIQAGRHFSDKVNRAIFQSEMTKRQAASAIAWTLISMVRPSVTDNALTVVDPVDKDIKRLCSEILGVGAGLEVLRLSSRIDGRTIRKRADRFDFEAFERGGGGKVLIEAKGTFQGVSADQHRASFRKKFLAEREGSGAPRGYSSMIGIIFSTWCDGQPRGVDVELLDPEGEPGEHFEETVREVIRFYARRLDEAAGERGRAPALFELAGWGDRLFARKPENSRGDVLEKATGEEGRVTFSGLPDNPSFVGGFQSAHAFPLPLALDDALEYRYTYTGIDTRPLSAIEHREFEALLEFHSKEGLFTVREGSFVGHFQLDAYGVLRGLMTEKPRRMTFGLPAQEDSPVIAGASRK